MGGEVVSDEETGTQNAVTLRICRTPFVEFVV